MSMFCERQLCSPAVDVVNQWRDGGRQVFGAVTRRYLSVFKLFAGETSQLGRHQLLQALNHMKLYPSKSQVYSMLRCASECSERDSQESITVGEFCVFASELEDHYEKFSALNHTHEIPGSTDPRYHHHTTQQSRPLPSAVKYKVFLGGSCNPTTWRKDIAIPHLNQHNLSYYDPQVENWSQELIAAEDEAKEASEVLLFVIDTSTRSVASLVEAAYLSGRRRKLVLVVKGVPKEVDNEVLSENELRDLRHSHAFLCDVVERQWCPIFDGLEPALSCASKVLHRSLHMSQLGLEDGAQPVRHPSCKPDDKLRNIKDVFREFDPGRVNEISLPNAFHALQSITGKEHIFPAYDQIVASCLESGDKTSFDFNEFCCLATEYGRCPPPDTGRGAFSRLVTSVQRWWSTFKTPSIPREVVEIKTAVFLGGTCQDTSWREDIAIPILRRHGLSFFNPKVTDWNMANIAIEAEAKNTSLYLLFVISESARGIASMIEAAHCIGQRRKVVLCIQQMQHGVCVYGEKLTDRAVRDYNRARCYLADLAEREGAPLFEDIGEAVETLAVKLGKELGSVSRPPSGQSPATQRPPSGHSQATQHPSSSHLLATQRQSSGHSPATQRPPSGHSPTIHQPTSGHLPATQRPSSGHSSTTQRPPSGHSPATQRPSSVHSWAVHQPPSGHSSTTQRPPSGHSLTIHQPPSGHLPATQRPSSGQSPATQRPFSGHSPTINQPTSGHLPATEHPSRGHSPATQRPPSGQSQATQRPSSGHSLAST